LDCTSISVPGSYSHISAAALFMLIPNCGPNHRVRNPPGRLWIASPISPFFSFTCLPGLLLTANICGSLPGTTLQQVMVDPFFLLYSIEAIFCTVPRKIRPCTAVNLSFPAFPFHRSPPVRRSFSCVFLHHASRIIPKVRFKGLLVELKSLLDKISSPLACCMKDVLNEFSGPFICLRNAVPADSFVDDFRTSGRRIFSVNIRSSLCRKASAKPLF